MRWVLLGILSTTLVTACADLKTITAPSNDLEDYRAYRVAAAEGTRLARAQTYLERHPNGSWSTEVHDAFNDEEPKFYEHAQATREGVRRYLADLPRGPHADAALALLIAMDSSIEDAELRDLARRVQYNDAKLERAAVQRRAIGETILKTVGVLLDEGVYGVSRESAPSNLRALMAGPGRETSTWGGVPRQREDDYFFVLPTRPERESRLLTLETRLTEQNGVIVAGTLEGSDLIVRWAEADQIVRLDSSTPEDRTEAQVFAMQRLEGAFERRFPSGQCPDLRKGEELYHRACDGWEGTVLAGTAAGDKDVIMIRSPRARKQPEAR